MAAQMTPRFRDLPDVDWSTFADGEVATYDEAEDKLTGEAGGGDAEADLATHAADTSNVHGIVDTEAVATDAEVASAVSVHSADTTAVHGITDTAALVTTSSLATHTADTTFVHGITDTTQLATNAALTAHASDATNIHGITDTATVPSTGEKAALAGTSGTPSVSNKYVTEDDPALGGGVTDLSDAVVLAPDDSARNVIQPTVNTALPLAVRGEAGQSTNLQEWQDDNAAVKAYLGSDGNFAVRTPGAAETTMFGSGGVDIAMPAGDPSGAAISVYDYSDANYGFQILTDGTAQWGNGTDALDTALERTGVGELSVNGEPVVLDDDARLVGGVDQGDIDSTVATHSADTTSVHGIADTSALATLPIAEANVTGLTAALAAKQPLDSDLTSLAALTTTSFGRGLLELANQGALLTAAGAAASTHSHAESDVTNLVSDLAAKQGLDATLTALAGLATGANKLAYSDGTDSFAQTDLTAAGRALLDDADAAAQLTTLGVSTFVKTVLDDTTAAAARTTLGAPTGTGVENGQPGLIAPTGGGWAPTSNIANTANRAEFVRFVPTRDLAVTKIAFVVAVAGGAGDQVNVGIYNSGMTTLLGSSGSVTPSPTMASTGLKVISLSATLNLTAGTVYYAAVVPSATAGQLVAARYISDLGLEIMFGTAIGTASAFIKDMGSFTLTSSVTSPSTTSYQAAVLAVRES